MSRYLLFETKRFLVVLKDRSPHQELCSGLISFSLRPVREIARVVHFGLDHQTNRAPKRILTVHAGRWGG